MHAIDLSIFLPREPDNVSLHCEMVLIDRLDRQTRCRSLFDECLVSVDGESENVVLKIGKSERLFEHRFSIQ
jgi:hypothetical protein